MGLKHCKLTVSSVQFSRSAMSDSLWLHGLQHMRLPCPSPSPRACSSSCPTNRWCQPTISSFVVPFSSCLQSFPAPGSFLMSWLFASAGWSIGASALASVLPMNVQDWFPLELTVLISLQSNGPSRVFSSTTVKASILWHSAFFMVHISHPYMTTVKTIALIICNSVGKLSAFYYVIYICHSFSSKEQVSFNFMAAVTTCSDFGAQENKIYYCFHCFPIYLPWSDWTRCQDLQFFECWVLSQLFHSALSFHQGTL